jgi:hypothetical protein
MAIEIELNAHELSMLQRNHTLADNIQFYQENCLEYPKKALQNGVLQFRLTVQERLELPDNWVEYYRFNAKGLGKKQRPAPKELPAKIQLNKIELSIFQRNQELSKRINFIIQNSWEHEKQQLKHWQLQFESAVTERLKISAKELREYSFDAETGLGTKAK